MFIIIRFFTSHKVSVCGYCTCVYPCTHTGVSLYNGEK